MLERDRAEWGEDTGRKLAEVVSAFGADLSQLGDIVEVEFTAAPATVPFGSVRAEYLIEPSRVKFHFWANPAFPVDMGARIRSALSSFPERSVVVEYVPEVNSWYTHIADLPFGATPALVEQLLRRLAAAIG